MSKLIFGCGYLGRRVASIWRDAGHSVYAVTRSDEKADALRHQGLEPLVFDLLDALPHPGVFRRAGDGPLVRPAIPVNLPAAETVLFAVGFDRSRGDQSVEDVFVGGLRNALGLLSPAHVQRFIYISSTGVYGQSDGDWVDEQTPCHPTRPGGRACLDAEALLRASPLADRAIILRMAGLYGPDRVPRSRELKQGLPISAAEGGYLNLIHVDDAAQVVVASEQLNPPELLVVSDGVPVPRRDYYAQVAELVGGPAPRFLPPDPQQPAAQRARGDKRIRPRRLQEKLALRLQFPDYRAGLTQILAEESG